MRKRKNQQRCVTVGEDEQQGHQAEGAGGQDDGRAATDPVTEVTEKETTEHHAEQSDGKNVAQLQLVQTDVVGHVGGSVGEHQQVKAIEKSDQHRRADDHVVEARKLAALDQGGDINGT